MRKTEIILLVVIFVSSILIINGVTEITNSLLVFSGILLTLLYLFFGFLLTNNKHLYKIFNKSTYQDLNALKIIMGAFLGIIYSNILIAIMFKLMLWLGAKAIIMSGGLTLIIGLMFLVIVQLVTRKIEFIHNLRYFIWMVFFAIIYFMPYRTLIEARYLEKYPDYSNAMTKYYENNSEENIQNFQLESQKYHAQKMREFGDRKDN
jgi:hypothetical protein